MEFFYYRFFAERAVRAEGPALITDKAGTPDGFVESLRRFEIESFPDRGISNPAPRPIAIATFRTTVSRINTKFRKTLGAEVGKACGIQIDGPRTGRRYYLALKKSQIRIKSYNILKAFGKPVNEYTIDRPFSDALDALRKQDYSQIIIRVNGTLKLLTIDGMARWLAAQSNEDHLSTRSVTIGEVLKYESKDNMECVEADLSILDIRTYFSNRLDSSKPNLVALIITQNGKPTEKPLGIITAADFLDKRYW